tara:strand:- start:2986 stop:7107 length:4122 start_codon:yes stop_codon:yes gene_type:complete
MSIASVSNRWLNRLYKILAILLVLLAVLISAFRLFLPYVEHYRQDFQNYINTNNQTHIVIGSLGMSWQRFGPTLIANRVTLVDTNGANVYVDHLEVQVDFWATLTTQRLVSSNMILDGAVVTLDQGAWHTQKNSDVKDKSTALNSNEQLDGFKKISDIFLNRINRFSLINSKISIENNLLERHFRVNNLHWLNREERHQAQGNIIVDELSSNNLNLKIDINGQYIDELKGMIYIEANHLDITPWLDSILTLDNEKTKADIGFSAWLKVDNGSIERLQLSLHDNLISWQESTQGDIQENTQDNPQEKIQASTEAGTETSQVRHKLTLSAGQLLLVKGQKAENFKLYSTPLLLQFDQEEAQEYIVQMNKTAQDFSIYLSSFDLALISQVSPLLIVPQNTRKLLSELNVSGQVNDIFFKKTAEDIQALAHFTNASTKYSQGIPGIDNISGTLSFTQQHLHLEIAAKQGGIDFNKHFIAPIPYESLQATVDLSIIDTGWQLKVNDIALNSDELKLNADLAIDSTENGEMLMSLLANITEGDASKAGHYYPLTIMSNNLVNYLNESLIDGQIKQAQVLINGPLAKFPFADKSGTFVVDAELEQATFKFSQDWPAIKNFYANLNFTNNSMLITGRSGTLTGLDVNGVQAAIDDLGNEAILTVDTLIEPVSATNVADLMAKSSLKNSVGSVLQQLQVKGDIEGEFHLNLPLSATENVLASGLINFADNKVSLQTPQMNFEQVNGQLSFENAKISTKNLSLKWQGLPLTLDVKGNDKADYYDTSIALKADWQNDVWLQHVSPNLKKYFAGQLQLQGELSLYQHHEGGFSYQFVIDSNLEPLQLKLPEPYTKLAQTKVPLKIEVNGQLERSTFNATYGDQLSFFGVLDHDTSHFSRAHIVLGNEKMLLPMDGLHVTTNLAQADFNVWQPLIIDIINTTSPVRTSQNEYAKGNVEHSTALFSSPERIRGTIGQLDLLGQNLHNVSFNLLDKTNWWLLQLNAKETRSQIKFYPDWLAQGIDINADFIHLVNQPQAVPNKQVAKQDKKQQEMFSASFTDDHIFTNMPKINFYCERCQIDNVNLGKVNFSLVRTDETVIKIENFNAKREQAEFNLSGEWQKLGATSTTSINGSLSLQNIEYELEQLGYGSIIRDSGGKLDFNVNWQGGPHDFEFSRLNGELNANIDDGYLAEVSDKARIFSVLSLQSIVRKLTLDFRDIFSEGMFYKNIKGDYHIKEGVLYTDNTRMNGSAGNLYIKGNTSFISNTLDYKMSYKPNLTSSLPVLAWIATLNPVVFLAGVAIDQVITSKVVSEFNFELTGNVSDPNFKEVNRKSRDVSVGRSKPPEFVDSNDKTKLLEQETMNKKSFNEFKENLFKENQPLEELNDD